MASHPSGIIEHFQSASDLLVIEVDFFSIDIKKISFDGEQYSYTDQVF